MRMIDDVKLDRVLPLLFRQVKVPEQAKAVLRAQLFKNGELADDDLNFVAAAGDLPENDEGIHKFGEHPKSDQK